MFADIRRGVLVHENGTPLDAGEPLTLELLLDLATCEAWGSEIPTTIYLVGGWNAETTPEAAWFAAAGGWTRVSLNRYPLIAQYKRGDGRKMVMYGTSQWFGDLADLDTCRRAFLRLRQLLRSTFDDRVQIMGTPARTGLDLLERSLPRAKDGTPYEYPILDDAIRRTLEAEIGQGRMEFLPLIGDHSHTTRLYTVDAVWMYASCIRHLPAPPLQHDEGINQFEGYRAGFYRVLFRVPQGWQHIGLLPVLMRDAVAGSKWVYPCEYHPGAEYMTVCSNAELMLALEQGWPCEILERWLFAPDRAANADPTRHWAEKLRMLRKAVTPERERDLAEPLRAAVRSLTIKAIGGMHRRGRTMLVETPFDRANEINADAEIELVTPTSIMWRKPIPLDPATAHLQQCHWAAMVWGRARARLAKAALQLPRESIIWLRSDALVTTVDPGWHGTEPGEFRVKRVFDLAGREIPTTESAYVALLGTEDAE